MGKFILYLFETGLCLVLLYLAYWFFLRKETYFNFNRIFLVGSMVLSLSVPLLHLNLRIAENSSMEGPAVRILQFRNYYQELVAMIDADFGEEPSAYRPGTQDFLNYRGLSAMEDPAGVGTRAGRDREGGNWHVSRILLLIYLAGVFYFLLRLAYLVIRLFRIARTGGTIRHDGFRMVEMKEEISPFSFFRFLYINREGLTESELQNILVHEQSHIRQRHTIDHLLAHGLAVFQWFNPFAWQIRNALKDTHEFIADRQVLTQGSRPIEYQTLLLKQVIGYHSVELVNNFNLKPIKKRISMMTKMKPGIKAKLKALLVIPFALIVFFLFADFTLKGPGDRMLDLNTRLIHSRNEKELLGLWERYKGIPGGEVHNAMGLVHISRDRFSYIEGLSEIREYFWRLEGDRLILSASEGGPGTGLKVEIEGEELTIWWNDDRYQTYRKTDQDNTTDFVLERLDLSIELPVISNFRILNKLFSNNLYLGYMKSGEAGLMFQGQSMDLDQLGPAMESKRADFNILDQARLTTVLWVDMNMPMAEVVRVKEELRKIGSLKIADAGYPRDTPGAISPLLFSSIGLPRLLPPVDAVILEKEDVEKEGIHIFTIDLAADNTTPSGIQRDLEAFIERFRDDKYLYSLKYDGGVSYGRYIETVDMVFSVVYGFRDRMAHDQHNAPYNDLGPDLQAEIKNKFPMVLSEAWSDP